MRPNGEQNNKENGRALYRIRKAKKLDENITIKYLKVRKTVKFKDCMINRIIKQDQDILSGWITFIILFGTQKMLT